MCVSGTMVSLTSEQHLAPTSSLFSGVCRGAAAGGKEVGRSGERKVLQVAWPGCTSSVQEMEGREVAVGVGYTKWLSPLMRALPEGRAGRLE